MTGITPIDLVAKNNEINANKAARGGNEIVAPEPKLIDEIEVRDRMRKYGETEFEARNNLECQ